MIWFNIVICISGSAVAGKANGMNSQRKSGLSGRKPLGDLSNSRKPDLNQSSKWKNTKNLTFIDEETGAGKKKNILKGSEKVQKGTRKVLSDISNSGMPNLPEASKKKQKLKLSTVREESLHHNAICEERFLHNHQDCIKSQNSAMDKDQFLSIVGLGMVLSRKAHFSLIFLVIFVHIFCFFLLFRSSQRVDDIH